MTSRPPPNHAPVHAFLLAALVVLAFVRTRLPPQRSPDAPDPLAILLPGAALLATLDLMALRDTPAGQQVLERLSALVGGAAATPACPPRLWQRVTRLGLVIPAAGPELPQDSLAIVAEGRFDVPAVLACTSALVRRRGGTPRVTHSGDFAGVSDDANHSEIAVRSDGPLISSGGDYLRMLVERAKGRAPPPEGPRERLHGALRAKLGRAPLLLSWVLSPGWLERWADARELAASPLSRVRVVGIAIDVGERVELRGLLATEDEASARELEHMLRALATRHQSLLGRWLGADAARRLRLERRGSELDAHADLPKRQLFERWDAVLGSP